MRAKTRRSLTPVPQSRDENSAIRSTSGFVNGRVIVSSLLFSFYKVIENIEIIGSDYPFEPKIIKSTEFFAHH